MTPGSLRPGQKQFPRNLKFAEDLFCNRGNSLQVVANDLSIGQQQQLVICILFSCLTSLFVSSPVFSSS